MLISKRISIMWLLLLFCVLGAVAEPGDLVAGTGMWLRFHHGPSTFALTPGASIDLSLGIGRDFRAGVKAVSGAFFGYSSGVELSATYAPQIGPWAPEVGIATQAVFNSTVFYYHGGTRYLEVASPEWGAGVVVRPIRFYFDDFGISALGAVVATDLQHFGEILILDVDLFRVFLKIGGEK